MRARTWAQIKNTALPEKSCLRLWSLQTFLCMQQMNKLKKRKAKKESQELLALEFMRDCQELHDALNLYVFQPHLSTHQRQKLRAIMAILCRAELKKVLATL